MQIRQKEDFIMISGKVSSDPCQRVPILMGRSHDDVDDAASSYDDLMITKVMVKSLAMPLEVIKADDDIKGVSQIKKACFKVWNHELTF